MRIRIEKGTARGCISAPPSKSMAHRLALCAALSEKSVITGVDFSEDILATLDCLRALGADVEVDGDRVTLGGLCPENFTENASLFCHESGSTLRFFIPLALLAGKKIKLYGSSRLLERPQSVYEELCREKGFYFSRDEEKITVCGKLTAGEYSVRGEISSQFITGLIYALFAAGGKSRIKLVGKVESLSYIKLTVKAFSDFGAKITLNGQNEIIIESAPLENRTLAVEGDYSNAAFLEALGVVGGEVAVSGLDEQSLQGDRVYKEIFASCDYDLSDCPDLGPIAFAVAAYRGGGHFVGTRRLKIKESDRAEAMKTELEKFGINVAVGENTVDISGTLCAPKEPLCGHNDHRIVMALAVLCTVTGGVIDGAEAVKKSYPDFFSKLETLGIKTEVESL